MAPGSRLDNGSSAELTFAACDYLFIFAAETGGAVDPLPLLRELAQRQVAAVGGPAADETETVERTEAKSELVVMLPAQPPDGYGLSLGATVTGADELTVADDVNIQVADFLNAHSATAARLWAGTQLAGAVSITRFPYEIFAAAGVHANSARRRRRGDLRRRAARRARCRGVQERRHRWRSGRRRIPPGRRARASAHAANPRRTRGHRNRACC